MSKGNDRTTDVEPFETLSRDLVSDHRAYRLAVSDWFDLNQDRLRPFAELPSELDKRIKQNVRLRRVLWNAGPARYGWPLEFGGLGGDPRHRGILLEQMARRGFPPPMALDHLEIIAPTLVEFLPADRAERLVPSTLRAETLWCQGFSEPEAGSDLTSLRLRAIEDGDGWRLDGHKIWCSWTSTADLCLALARSGGDGSRGLTMFYLPMDSPGLETRQIMQANGQPEFAEVFFDGVQVPRDNVVGDPGHGWEVARFLLSCERGAFAWQRHGWLARWLGEAMGERAHDLVEQDRLAESAMRVLAVRALSRRTLRAFAAGERPGSAASVDKVLLSRTEQFIFDTIREVSHGNLELGLTNSDLQEKYLASRVASIYGGAREIQLNLVAQRLMGLPHG